MRNDFTYTAQTYRHILVGTCCKYLCCYVSAANRTSSVYSWRWPVVHPL